VVWWLAFIVAVRLDPLIPPPAALRVASIEAPIWKMRSSLQELWSSLLIFVRSAPDCGIGGMIGMASEVGFPHIWLPPGVFMFCA